MKITLWREPMILKRKAERDKKMCLAPHLATFPRLMWFGKLFSNNSATWSLVALLQNGNFFTRPQASSAVSALPLGTLSDVSSERNSMNSFSKFLERLEAFPSDILYNSYRFKKEVVLSTQFPWSTDRRANTSGRRKSTLQINARREVTRVGSHFEQHAVRFQKWKVPLSKLKLHVPPSDKLVDDSNLQNSLIRLMYMPCNQVLVLKEKGPDLHGSGKLRITAPTVEPIMTVEGVQ